jgi:HSP20 family protein
MSRKKLKTSSENNNSASGDGMGQLAVDVYETDNDIIFIAPIAGVDPDDVEVSITDDVVSVEGERKTSSNASDDDYFVQECYWGKFSRQYILPVEVDAEKGKAEIKDGILTVTIPKAIKSQKRVISVKKK